MTMTIGRRRPSVLILVLLAVLALAPTAPPAAPVVAVGDVHGDLQDFKAILREAAVIDEAGRWMGGNTTLVQTGDLIDRGPESRGVLDFVMALEPQAAQSGGRVIVLLGNHDMMNIMGDLRYVTEQEFAAYAEGGAEQRRQAGWQRFAAWMKDHGAPPATPAMQSDWLKSHPLGFMEQRAAFDRNGKYGRWLRQRPAVALVGDTLFVHGGISPALAGLSPKEINDRIAEELRTFDRARADLEDQDEMLASFTYQEVLRRAADLVKADQQAPAPATPRDAAYRARRQAAATALMKCQDGLSVSRDGPLWFRGLAEWTDDQGAAPVGELLKKQGAARIVVGHSTQKGRITERWNGRVFLIDTGMLQSYQPGGRRSALEINGSQITAVYEDGKVSLSGGAPSQKVP